jgi:CheY-like chemotaxis protein
MIENEISQAAKRPAHRILVVDGDDDTRKLNTEVLIQFGYHVDAVEDGAAGWEALQLESYDLLVTDNNMPKVPGVELLMKLRAARMALPVIMATATLPKKDLTRYPWLQPVVTLPKPYTVDELLGTVEEVLHTTDVVRKPLPMAIAKHSGLFIV